MSVFEIKKNEESNFKSIMDEAVKNNDNAQDSGLLSNLLTEKNIQKLCGNIVKKRTDKNNIIHKSFGILPDLITNSMVRQSVDPLNFEICLVTESSDEDEKKDSNEEEGDDFDITQIFIISGKSLFIQAWKTLEIVCCVLSSYIYIFLAAYGIEE